MHLSESGSLVVSFIVSADKIQSRLMCLLCPIYTGDILSDLGASLVGGLGVTPSGNIGIRQHGTV